MAPLKLLAFDDEDLQVLSAHVQDALLRSGDMVFEPDARRFVALLNRFDWDKALRSSSTPKSDFERRRCALRFDHVKGVRFKNITPGDQSEVLELLAVRFTASALPEGHVELVFAGGGALRLDVECIEVSLNDLGPGWKARSKPRHDIEPEG